MTVDFLIAKNGVSLNHGFHKISIFGDVSINKNNYLQFIISRGYPPRLHEKFFLISMIGFPPS